MRIYIELTHNVKKQYGLLTKKRIEVIVLPQMQEIINKWGNENKPKNYIFPYLYKKISAMEGKRIVQNLTRQINDHIQSIGNSLGIDNVTTYSARHSFATVLKRSGANIAYISESLGHTDLKTTENLYKLKISKLLQPKTLDWHNTVVLNQVETLITRYTYIDNYTNKAF